jgi:hypothetical protein
MLQDTVRLHGSVERDGDYYVIDPDPRSPGPVARVHKDHVLRLNPDGDAQSPHGHAHQNCCIVVQRDAPVVRLDLGTASQSLGFLARNTARNLDTVKVRFRNFSSAWSKHWIVVDAHTGQVVLDRLLGPRETYPDPHGKEWRYLSPSNAGYGEIRYRNTDGGTWGTKSWIEDEDVIDL